MNRRRRAQHPVGVNPHTQPPSTQLGAPQQSPGSPQHVSERHIDVGMVGRAQLHSPLMHSGAANASDPQYSAHRNGWALPAQVQTLPAPQVHESAMQVAEPTRRPASQQSGPRGTVPHPAPDVPASVVGGPSRVLEAAPPGENVSGTSRPQARARLRKQRAKRRMRPAQSTPQATHTPQGNQRFRAVTASDS